MLEELSNCSQRFLREQLEKRKRNRVDVGVRSISLRNLSSADVSRTEVKQYWNRTSLVYIFYHFLVSLALNWQIQKPLRTIRRYGGSTSIENPWPEDEFADRGSLEAR